MVINHVREHVVKPMYIGILLLFLTACSGLEHKTLSSVQTHPPAVIEKLEITSKRPAFSGQVFDNVGSYEFISGVVTVRVDPEHPANRSVLDLDKAIETDGFVRFQTDLAILRPVSPAKASRVLVVDIANRGNKLALARLADGANQYDSMAQSGNGWPMRQGHTFAWIGWQGDVPLGKAGALIGTRFPVAKNGTTPITGKTIEEFIFEKAQDISIGNLTYPAAELNAAKATLSVRATTHSMPKLLPATAWRYIDERTIKITRPQGFDASAIYHFTYEAQDPLVMGLGLVALRDVTAFLESGQPDASGEPNPMADIRPEVKIVLGISQSGRFLRDFIWYGFNESAEGGRIFDAAMPLIAGSRKSYANARFAQPGRYSRQHEDHVFYGDQFPFTYATTTDPISGKTDGIFSRCEKTNTCPKLMHLDSSLEFWQARSSLLVTDGLGHPVPVPENVRLYLMAGTQHGPAAKPEYGICQQLNNPAVQAPLVRAMLARLIEWVRDEKMPPSNRYPMPGNGLVEPEQAAIGFPDLSHLGVQFPKVFNKLYLIDYQKTPPVVDLNKPYKVLLPRSDQNGHDIDGVRLPEIEVSLATHTGWGLRKAGFAEGQLCGINGTYAPFSKDAAERTNRQDPRLSIAERYQSKQQYLDQFKQAGVTLVNEGFLLEEDLNRMLIQARKNPLIKDLSE